MNNDPQPNQADEYRELSSDLRGKERVLASIFTAWWAVNGIMIAWLLTTERLNAILLIFVGLFGFVINFALHIQVWEIRDRYHQQSKKLRDIQRKAKFYPYHEQSEPLRDIQDEAKLYPPEPYRRRRWLKSENVYHVLGISLIIIWFHVVICGLVLAFLFGPLTSLMPG